MQWIASPLINPLTNRKIKKNGPTYLRLQSECERISIRRVSNSIEILGLKQVENGVPKRYSQRNRGNYYQQMFGQAAAPLTLRIARQLLNAKFYGVTWIGGSKYAERLNSIEELRILKASPHQIIVQTPHADLEISHIETEDSPLYFGDADPLIIFVKY